MAILSVGNQVSRGSPVFRAVALSLALSVRIAGQDLDEYEVKAAYIYNLSKFVEWPQADGAANFEICIVGDNPFEGTLDQLTKGKSAYGRSIQIRRLKEPSDAKSCQIAFVSSAERVKATKLINAVSGTAVLTVGENQEFLRTGGMIALFLEDSHVNILINTSATQNSGIKVSAKLMTLAKLFKND